MSKTKSDRPLVASVPLTVVKETMNNALSSMFQDDFVHCEKHKIGNELIIVMMANGVCATLHIQELPNKKGVAV